MVNQKYTLRYLPLFREELETAVMYIANHLGNPTAAGNLLDNVEKAILERLENNPEGYEPVPSKKKRDYPYYRIYCSTCCFSCNGIYAFLQKIY